MRLPLKINIIAAVFPWVISTATALGGGPKITSFDLVGRRLSWTNSVSNGVYQVQSLAQSGSWTTLTNLISNSTSNSVTVVMPSSSSAIYRIAWIDAPPAEPVGTWEYTGFESDGSLSVTGLVTVTATNPLSGTLAFQPVAAPHTRFHPVGQAGFEQRDYRTKRYSG